MAQSAPKVSPYELELRELGLSYPGTREDFPWGHRVLKAGKKAFVFMGSEDGSLSLSVKLPSSGEAALMLPFCEPTGYGLGKSGWVSASFKAKDRPPMEVLRQWLEESYRAVAPRTLVKQLDAARAGGAAAPVAAKKARAAAKKPATKKSVPTEKRPTAAASKRAR